MVALKQPIRSSGEQGFVLIVTLLIIVVITLSSVALIAATRTNISNSGNIAFRQAATRSGDVAIDNALGQINTLIGAGTAGTALDSNSGAGAPFRYYAAFGDADSGCTTNGTVVFSPRTYRFSDTLNGADGFACAAKLASTPSGYTLYYVVHRMASTAGACPGAGCMAPVVSTAAAGGASPGSSQDVEAQAIDAGGTGENLAYYRITVKVSGPRQNNRYLQAFVY